MTLAIRKGNNIKNNFAEIFSELNFKPGKRVFIKPNLCGRAPIYPGENSSLEVADALLKILTERGCEVIIGHGALLGTFDHKTTFDQTLKESGFEKYLSWKQVKIQNLDDLERQEVMIDGVKFHIPLTFFKNEIDTYINLAKIKTHMETEISFCLKNQMGLLMPEDRIAMHKINLEKLIAGIATIIRPDLAVLEGYPAMQKNGPHHGSARNLKLLACGDDMVELDSMVARLLGYSPEKIPLIVEANSRAVGKISINDQSINREYYIKDFKPAKKIYKYGLRINVYPTYSCSRCITAVNNAGRDFKSHFIKYNKFILKALFSKEKLFIVFGNADNLKIQEKGRFICIGHCSKKFAEKHNAVCLDKCPPSQEETREFIEKNTIN